MALRDTNTRISFSDTSFKLPFIFMGNETLATGVKSEAKLLTSLIENGWTPDALILAQRKPAKKPHTVESIAKQLNIPVKYVAQKSELESVVEQYSPSFAVLAAFGMIITQNVLDMIPSGVINIHPSLLPKYRGTAPIETAMLNGDSKTGVSLMKLDAGMDTGDLYDQRTLEADVSHYTKQQLHDALLNLGSQMLLDHIDSIASGRAKTTAQVATTDLPTKKIEKSDGEINWSQPAKLIERQIRAYKGWPKSRTVIRDKQVVITEVAVTDFDADPAGDLEVGDGAMFISANDRQLEIVRLQPIGKKEMDAKSFINGYLN